MHNSTLQSNTHKQSNSALPIYSTLYSLSWAFGKIRFYRSKLYGLVNMPISWFLYIAPEHCLQILATLFNHLVIPDSAVHHHPWRMHHHCQQPKKKEISNSHSVACAAPVLVGVAYRYGLFHLYSFFGKRLMLMAKVLSHQMEQRQRLVSYRLMVP